MLKLTRRYTNALLEYAINCGLEDIYRQALMFVLNDMVIEDAPDELRQFLVQMPDVREDMLTVLYGFLDMARNKLNLADAEVFSAVPLSAGQKEALEAKLSRMFDKQVEVVNTIDPSLLGGVRVVVDNTVMDDTVKRKLMDMKKNIYEGMDQRE